MSITVRFYENFKKRDNSTLLPAAGDSYADYACVLKDSSSIVNPYIEVALPSQDPHVYNYAYISQYDRFYYVTDWTYSRGVWTTNLVSDVLASFKTEIGDLTKYVNRSSAEYNGDLTDTMYPTSSRASLSFITGDNPFRVSPFGSFIVGIVGKSQINVPNIGGVNYYLMSYSQMQELLDYLMSGAFAALLKDDAVGMTEAVVKAIANPIDYIESCIWFPFSISGVSGTVQPQIGWWSGLSPLSSGCTPLGGGVFDSLKFSPGGAWSNSFTLTDHTQISRGAYLNAEPYSYYTFHLEPWGDIPLDGKLLLKYASISYSIVCEGLSGMAAIEIYGGSDLLARRLAQVGVPTSIGQILNSIDKLDSVGGAVTAAGSAINSVRNNSKFWDAFKGFFTLQTPYRGSRGLKAMGEALTNVGRDVLSGVEAYSGEASLIGANGSLISYTGTYTVSNNMFSSGPYIKIVRFNQTSDNNAEIGSPLCAIRKLNTIPGYISCADGEHNIAAFDSEKAQISSYLTGGFFYE